MHGFSCIHFLVVILGVLIFFLQLYFNNELQGNELASGPHVFIAIISARDHFSQRKATRQSWIQTLKDYKNINYKFFIGKKCSVHPLDRIDKFSCEDEELSFPKDGKVFKNVDCSVAELDTKSPNSNSSCYSGFGFHVKHPLKLHSIGVRYEFLHKEESSSLILKDAEEVFENISVNQQSCTKIIDGFCYFSLKDKYILPKDFEGMISLYGGQYSNASNEICQFRSDGSFHFTFGVVGNLHEKYQDGRCSNVIATFTLEDAEGWEKHKNLKLKRQTEWHQEEDKTDDDLYIEMRSYDDIIYLHNVIDVYRNLPLKVLDTIKWSHTNYPSSFVLKLDDDVEIDVPALMNWVSKALVGQNSLGIWSHFYHQRSVPQFGKWADFEFEGITYPAFPSGSGYILSGRLVYLLSMQAPFLRSFQGEDISMGIWTQVLRIGRENVDKNHMNCWLPSHACNRSIILPEILAVENAPKR